jgi:fructose-1,6-bisphosphatase/inositol monophosphatase family enzyme
MINENGGFLEEILDVAKDAARKAGDEIRKAMMAEDRQTITTKSSSTDLVTETDQKCEELVIRILQQKFPLHKIIGEESSGDGCKYELTDDPTWTIDPIGTSNIHNNNNNNNRNKMEAQAGMQHQQPYS